MLTHDLRLKPLLDLQASLWRLASKLQIGLNNAYLLSLSKLLTIACRGAELAMRGINL
jgi:hypothetical protein